MFEDIGLCGDMEFFSGKLPEKDLGCLQNEPEATVEDDYTDDEIDIDELERRMRRDKMRLKRLKEQNKSREGVDMVKQRQSQEQARRKKMSGAQDVKNKVRNCWDWQMVVSASAWVLKHDLY